MRLPGDGFNVKVGAGGVINASAGISDTVITSNARVVQGKNSSVVSTGREVRELESEDDQVTDSGLITGAKIVGGMVNYNAVNEITAYDDVRLDTGGAIEVAKTESKITADQVSSTVILDENAVIKAITANLGGRTEAEFTTSANSKTYGIAGAAAVVVWDGKNFPPDQSGREII